MPTTQPIAYQSPLTGILQDLLGRQTRGQSSSLSNTAGTTVGTGTQTGTSGGESTGSTTGSTTGTIRSTAELGPLLQAFAQSSQGMTPEMLSTLISSIFTEGSQQVPALIGAYANATGSRASGNSGTRMALDELNRSLSTQAAQALMNYNSSAQQTAANTAAQIAANTRQQESNQQQAGTSQQAQTANTTQATTSNQTQLGTQQQQQQQTQQQSVNPTMAAMVGLGGTALNLADKSGLLKRLGLTGESAATGGGVGSIAGGSGLVQNPGGINLAPAASPTIGVAAPSSGLLAGPGTPTTMSLGGQTVATPVTSSTVTPMALGPAPAVAGGAAVPVLGAAGNLASGFNWGTRLPAGFLGGSSFFGGGGIDLSGATAGVGLNPFNNGGIAIGSDFVDPGTSGSLLGAGGGGFDWGTLPSYASDALSGVGQFAGGLWDAGSSLLDTIGSFFADGGQVSTGGASAVRNRNYMGAAPRRQQQDALNYEGYGPASAATGGSTAAVGGSGIGGGSVGTPVGLAPGTSMAMMASPLSGGPSSGAISYSPDQIAGIQAEEMARQQAEQRVAAQQARQAQDAAILTANIQANQFALNNAAGGSGGVGEGAAPSGAATDGISTSGLGMGGSVANAVAPALGMMGIPGLSVMGSITQALSNQISQAAVPANMAALDALMAALSQDDSAGAGSGGLAGAPDEGSQGDASGVTGVSAGNASDGEGEGIGSAGVGGEGQGDSGGDSGGDSWADGGLVLGRGTGTSDSIKVKSKQPGGKTLSYSDGEFVMPTDVVAFYGKNVLQQMIDAVHTPVSR